MLVALGCDRPLPSGAAADALARAKTLHDQALHAYRIRDRAGGDTKAVQALAAYRQAEAMAPELGSLHYELVASLVAAKQLAKAEAQTRAWLERFPADALHQETLGKLLFRLGRHDEAARALEASIQAQPGDIAARRRLVEALSFEGARDRALAAVDSLLAASQREPDAETIAVAARTLSRFQEPARAVPWWQRLCALRPADAAAHLELGAALRSLGRYDEALQALAVSEADGRLGAEACVESAACHAKEGRNAEAAKLLVAALVRDPTLAAAYHQLADALRRLGKLEAAEAMAQASLSLQPAQRERARVSEYRSAGRAAEARLSQALAQALAGRFRAADEAIGEAEEGDFELELHRARLYLDWLRVTEAAQILARLSGIDGTGLAKLNALRQRANAMLAEPESSLSPGESDPALSLRRQITRTPWPDAAPQLVELARLEESRDRDQALMAARLAVAADPTHVEGWRILARLLAAPAEVFWRREAWARACDLAPGDKVARAGLEQTDVMVRGWLPLGPVEERPPAEAQRR